MCSSVRDPAVLPKAIKNEAEIAGHQAAQARDGAAVSRFLQWIEDEAPKGELDEMMAAEKLEGLRDEHGDLKDLSFDTISALGRMARCSIIKVTEETNRRSSPARSTWSIRAGNIRTEPPT